MYLQRQLQDLQRRLALAEEDAAEHRREAATEAAKLLGRGPARGRPTPPLRWEQRRWPNHREGDPARNVCRSVCQSLRRGVCQSARQGVRQGVRQSVRQSVLPATSRACLLPWPRKLLTSWV